MTLCVSAVRVAADVCGDSFFSSLLRMSVFDRLTSLIPSASRQTKERSPPLPSPPLPLASPVVRKRPIHIPSFLEDPLGCDHAGAGPIDSSR